MKKLLSHILCILVVFAAAPSMAQEYRLSTDNLPNGKIVVTFDLLVDPGLSQTYVSDQYFSQFKNLTKFTRSTEKGFPEVLSKQVALLVDPDADYSVQIVESVPTTFNLTFPYLVGRGTITRNQNPEDVRHVIAPRSRGLKKHPAKQIDLEEKFFIRNVSGFNFRFNVTEFDTELNTAKVFKHLKFEITPKPNSTRTSTAAQRDRSVARELHKSLPQMFLNYDNNAIASTYTTRGSPGDILVIYTARDASAIQPYIQHKQSKGFSVRSIQVATGTNVKSVIQNAYNQNPNIFYVQLVGDWADIKSDIGTYQNAPMDPMLGRVSGNDNYPDLAIGRFSANSASDVSTQVNKTIAYEQNPGLPFRKIGLGIGSEEGAGIGDDGEIDYAHIDIIKRNKLLAKQQYSSVGAVYGAGGNASQISSFVNSGAHVINYCGHGNETSWGTPWFLSDDVNNLANANRLPVIFSVACLNGAFHTGTSFSETWLRKSNGGAVATLMATINQPWQPPMRGQDYFNDLLTGGYSYSAGPGNGTNTTEGKTRLGDIVVTGFSLMYAESSASDDLDTISTWTLFGDSSLLMVDNSVAPAATNLAKGRPVSQSTTAYGGAASRAVDGNTSGLWSGSSISHTAYESNAWWQVNLGSARKVTKVRLWNRTDCCSSRLSNFTVYLLDQAGREIASKQYPGTAGATTDIAVSGSGVYSVWIQMSGMGYLSLAEVQVFGY